MSKRKSETSSKHARAAKIAAKAQRVTEAVRSPKHGVHSIAAGLTKPPFERSDEVSKQDTPPVERPATALQDDRRQTVTHNLNKGFDFSPAAANLRAYQAKLLEMTQAELQFAFEFTRRVAVIRSPVEFANVIAEFASRRISMFRKYSQELVELNTKQLTA
jgi:hypothetical protein